MHKTDEDMWMEIAKISKADFEKVSQTFFEESTIEEAQKRNIIRYGLRVFANLEIIKNDKPGQYRQLLLSLAGMYLTAKHSE